MLPAPARLGAPPRPGFPAPLSDDPFLMIRSTSPQLGRPARFCTDGARPRPLRPRRSGLARLLTAGALLALGALLAACGEERPTAAGSPEAWPAPRWQEERSRSSGVSGAVVIKAPGRTSLELGLYDQGLRGMTPGLSRRVLLPGEAVRIDWRYDLSRELEPEEAAPEEAIAEGRTEAWRLLLTFGYADLGEWNRSVLLWARPDQIQRTILAGVAPPTFEDLPVGQPVWIGGAAAGDPGFGDGLKLRIRGDELEARVPGESGAASRPAPKNWIGILALRIETHPATE